MESVERLGVENKIFYFPSKNITPLLLVKTYRRIRREIRNYHPDLIHVHFGMIYAFTAAYSTLKPLVITFHGSDINRTASSTPMGNWLKVVLGNLAVLRARKVICVSSHFLHKFIWRRDRIVVLPLGIDTNVFLPIEKNGVRSKLNWDPSDPVILFNGNNPRLKRLDIAEETIRIVKETFPGARLEVLNGVDTPPEMVPYYLNASDCLLLCSDSEGSPTMVKEALACNVPVVAVDVGDVKERLRGVTGSFMVDKDPVVLAKAIIGVIRSGERSNGRNRLIGDGLTEQAVAEKLLKIYQLAASR
jgi:glycosyltransferase involved in cell wall biosynthesis